jgi:hypothetical protein
MSLIPSRIGSKDSQLHNCEVAIAQRLKALKELMDHQDGELERLMYLSH